MVLYIAETLRTSPRFALSRPTGEQVLRSGSSYIHKTTTLLPSPKYAAHNFAPPSAVKRANLPHTPTVHPFNSHSPAFAATASGFLLTALSNARVNA